jgi:hypothetical protein
MSSFRWSAGVAAALSPVIVGAVLNIATGLVEVPDGTQLYVLLGSLLIIGCAVAFDVRKNQQAARMEQQEREERERKEREEREERERKEREEREERERKEREEREERERKEREEVRQEQEVRALMRPIRVPKLKRLRGFKYSFGKKALESPQYHAVDTAISELRTEMEAALTQYGVEDRRINWSYEVLGKRISKITNDGRWIIIGKNVDHLLGEGNMIYAHEGEYGNISPSAPTEETTSSFVEGAAVVVRQIKTLRNLPDRSGDR